MEALDFEHRGSKPASGRRCPRGSVVAVVVVVLVGHAHQGSPLAERAGRGGLGSLDHRPLMPPLHPYLMRSTVTAVPQWNAAAMRRVGDASAKPRQSMFLDLDEGPHAMRVRHALAGPES